MENDKHNKSRIYAVVAQIPPGSTMSYGEVAKRAGLPGYARYVGKVLGDLPSDSELPWHRVINARGRLSFPVGSPQYRKQYQRLKDEGAF